MAAERGTKALLFEADGSKREGKVFVAAEQPDEDGLVLWVQRDGEVGAPGLEVAADEALALARELTEAVEARR